MAKSNTKLIGIIVAAVLVVGLAVGSFFVFFNEDDSGVNSETAEQQSGGSSQSSINDLLARAENVTCTFSYTDDQSGTVSSGTVYIASGERMSGDFVSAVAGQEQQITGMIQTAEKIYTWDKNTKQGVEYTKGAFDSSDQEGQEQQPNEDEAVDRDQDYDFSCQKWSVDDGKFNPPSDVTFTNFDQELQQAQELSNEARDIQAQACQQIADETQRQACEQALQ